MAQSFFDRFFGKPWQAVDPELPWALMALNALVFLPPEKYGTQLGLIFGADLVSYIPAAQPSGTAVLLLRSGGRVIVAFQGTDCWPSWARYFFDAGALSYGPAPGAVFKPFADTVRAQTPSILGELGEGDRLLITGHSLGAAVGAIFQGDVAAVASKLETGWLFACPQYGNQAYVSLSKAKLVTLNLTGDPIPYLPPDVWQAIDGDQAGLRWQGAWRAAQGLVSLATDPGNALQPRGLDLVIQLAAAMLDWNRCPHNTYQYLLRLWSLIQAQPSADAVRLFGLVDSLGLLAPWAAPCAQVRAWASSTAASSPRPSTAASSPRPSTAAPADLGTDRVERHEASQASEGLQALEVIRSLPATERK